MVYYHIIKIREVFPINIYRYATNGGKDLILEYVNSLQEKAKAEYYALQVKLEKDGIEALNSFNTRQLKNKLWEIKVAKNRYMYVLADEDNLYILHACRKQKGKAEKFELKKAMHRAKELGEELGKRFV